MITVTQREDNARSKKISGSTVKDMAKIQHFQTCEIFTLSIHLLCLLLNAKIGISTMARIAFENRAKKTIINVPTPC